jgi:hypothetical protein
MLENIINLLLLIEMLMHKNLKYLMFDVLNTLSMKMLVMSSISILNGLTMTFHIDVTLLTSIPTYHNGITHVGFK